MSHHLESSAEKTHWSASRTLVVLAVVVGVILRILYVSATPFNVRTSLTDTKGHLQYIHYLVDNHSIPPASLGWETHQAPLYYVGAAMWSAIGLPDDAVIQGLQGVGLLCAMATVLLGAWIGLMLFPDKKHAWLAALFTLGIAVWPGLIELSSRINNDVLYTVLSFLCFGLLLQWWQAPNRDRWLGLCFGLSLLMLTKTNGLLFLPAVFLCLLINDRQSWKERLNQLWLGLLILAACVGWYHGIRLHQTYGVGNLNLLDSGTAGLNKGLFVGNQFSHYVWFSPWDVIMKPYVSPWEAATDRQYLWEYLYRSAYFGEYKFGATLAVVAQEILLSGYGLMILAIAGIVKMFRQRDDRLMVFALVVIMQLIGLTAYRLLHPYACNQDFRFIPVIVGPILALSLLGLPRLGGRWGKIALGVVLVHLSLCAVFIAGVWILKV